MAEIRCFSNICQFAYGRTIHAARREIGNAHSAHRETRANGGECEGSGSRELRPGRRCDSLAREMHGEDRTRTHVRSQRELRVYGIDNGKCDGALRHYREGAAETDHDQNRYNVAAIGRGPENALVAKGLERISTSSRSA